MQQLRARRGLHRIAAPRHGGQRGTPVLFDAVLLPRLRAATGDAGGRALFAEFPREGAWLDLPGDAALQDIDTPAAWDALQGR